VNLLTRRRSSLWIAPTTVERVSRLDAQSLLHVRRLSPSNVDLFSISCATCSYTAVRQLATFRLPHRVARSLCASRASSSFPLLLSVYTAVVSEHRRRHLRSSSHRTLAVPRTRTTLGDRSFAVSGPRVWNSLPATTRQITSYGQFRQHLKHIYSGSRNRSAL